MSCSACTSLTKQKSMCPFWNTNLWWPLHFTFVFLDTHVPFMKKNIARWACFSLLPSQKPLCFSWEQKISWMSLHVTSVFTDADMTLLGRKKPTSLNVSALHVCLRRHRYVNFETRMTELHRLQGSRRLCRHKSKRKQSKTDVENGINETPIESAEQIL